MSTTPAECAIEARTNRTHSLAELLCRALDMRVIDLHLSETRVQDICSDSRKARPGSLFVAISGAAGDGARFIHDAAARGASVVIADRDLETPTSVQFVRVADAREALARLAAHFHGLDELQSRGEMAVAGVTGTNGKSTIAYMVREILRAAGKPAALFGTIEYDLVGRKLAAALTTPDPIDLVRYLVEAHAAGARHAVMEVSSHSLDQRRAAGIQLSTAVFTNLTQDHLDYHKTMDEYARAKRRMFVDLSRDATAVVNIDDAAGEGMIANCRAKIIRYGMNPGADLMATRVEASKTGCRFRMNFEGRTVDASIRLAGQHNIYNALGAAGAALALGIDLDGVVEGMAGLERVPGRLQRVETGGLGFDVFVDYAHTDDALRNVLAALKSITSGKLWCVFGCGGDRDRTKRPRMAQAVADGADSFIITSDNPRTEDPLAIIADIESGLTPESRIRGLTEPDRASAIHIAVSHLRPNDTLLIAGKGHEDYQIIGTEKIHFDDVEVASEALKARMGKS